MEVKNKKSDNAASFQKGNEGKCHCWICGISEVTVYFAVILFDIRGLEIIQCKRNN